MFGRGIDPERSEPSPIAEGKCELGADLAVPDIRGTGSQLGIALSQLHIRGKRVIQREKERDNRRKNGGKKRTGPLDQFVLRPLNAMSRNLELNVY